VSRPAGERAAWRDRTREEPLDPDLAICDPHHHHLWGRPPVPASVASAETAETAERAETAETAETAAEREQRYLLDELLADTGSGHRVLETVFVECGSAYLSEGPPELRAVGETTFVAEAAAEAARRPGNATAIAGIVAFADLRLGAAVAPVLDAHRQAGGGRFCGIRHAVAWDADAGVGNHRTAPPPHLLDDPSFREGVRELGRQGLTYDVWLYHPQLPEVVALARAVEGTTIVVDHLGGPLGIGPYAGHHDEVLEDCRASLAALAELPDVRLKLGGIGMTVFGQRWHHQESPPGSEELARFWGPHVRWCIDTFGPARCLFESNFPPDRASCSYVVLWNAFKRMAAGYDASERAQLFRGSALDTYGLAGSERT
jgi:predicted TIM-barrel fold metal-dependent hydrolase